MDTIFESDLYFVSAATATPQNAPSVRRPSHHSLILMLKGKASFRTAESQKTRRINPGDLYCRFAHVQVIQPEPDFRYLSVSFNGKKADAFLNSIGFSPEQPLVRKAPDQIHRLMREIQNSHSSGAPRSPFFFVSRISTIAELVWELNQETRQHNPTPHSTRMRDILEQNEYRCTGTKELAETMGIHPDTLRKACLRETGKSAQDLLTRFRLQRAKKLLQTTPYKIEYIALTCGYSNDKHFYKSFRQHTGCSPATWRKSHQE